jgi:hypothetical protein
VGLKIVWQLAGRGFQHAVSWVNPGVGDHGNAVGGDPRQLGQLAVEGRSDATNCDAAYYYYDAIPQALPPVNRVDIGASTQPIRGFTFSAWARNLQADRHQEATSSVLPAGEIRRSVIFKLTWESERDKTAGNP